MLPVSPVMQGFEPIETVFGEGQPEYLPLPAVYLSQPNVPVITRWRFTQEERVKIANGADLVHTSLTFGSRLQPVCLQVCMPDEDPDLDHTL